MAFVLFHQRSMSSTSPPCSCYPNTIGPSQNISIKSQLFWKELLICMCVTCDCIHIVIHMKYLQLYWVSMVWLLLQTMRVLDWGSPGPGGECREEALESALKSLQQCRLDPRELPRPHRHLDSCGRSRSTSCLSHLEYRQHSKTDTRQGWARAYTGYRPGLASSFRMRMRVREIVLTGGNKK